MAIEPWQLVDSQIVFDHRWYRLRQDTVRLPDGRIIDDYFVSVRPDIVVVFALTDDNRVPFVRQFRQGLGEVTLELPAGFITTEPPEVGAERELLEETGYRCASLRQTAAVASDASRHTNRIYTFLGTGAVPIAAQDLDETEGSAGVEVELIARERILSLVRAGEIVAMSSLVAIYRAFDEL